MKSLIVFILGGLAFGGASLGIGYASFGEETLLQGGTAFGLAFVPSMITLAWVLFTYRSSPEMQLVAGLGGMGIRMAIALGGGMFLTQARPDDFREAFWYWLALFYLVLLAFEITLLVRQQPKLNGSPQA